MDFYQYFSLSFCSFWVSISKCTILWYIFFSNKFRNSKATPILELDWKRFRSSKCAVNQLKFDPSPNWFLNIFFLQKNKRIFNNQAKMALGCWMRTKSRPVRCTTPAANLQVHLDFSCSRAALTCFVEPKTPPTLVWPVWVLKLLVYMWYSNLLLASHSIFLMKMKRQSNVSSISCHIDRAAGSVWLHAAKRCHLWLCFLARVRDCNLLCFNLWLWSSIHFS